MVCDRWPKEAATSISEAMLCHSQNQTQDVFLKQNLLYNECFLLNSIVVLSLRIDSLPYFSLDSSVSPFSNRFDSKWNGHFCHNLIQWWIICVLVLGFVFLLCLQRCSVKPGRVCCLWSCWHPRSPAAGWPPAPGNKPCSPRCLLPDDFVSQMWYMAQSILTPWLLLLFSCF